MAETVKTSQAYITLAPKLHLIFTCGRKQFITEQKFCFSTCFKALTDRKQQARMLEIIKKLFFFAASEKLQL